MSAKVIWLFLFVILYWSYCVSMGIKSMRKIKTASDYFIAGRQLGMWVFVLAATATSFSGWTFMGHPGLVYRDGFQYAYASFYGITIPFTGVMFLKRQWMLGKRFGYVTPGEMLSDYFQGDGIRILTVLVALLFSIPYLGVQLGASGFLFNVLTDGLLTREVGMWVLSIVVLIYVATGGLRAVAYVDTLQCILLAAGIVTTGIIALNVLGGWEQLNQGLAVLAQNPQVDRWYDPQNDHVSYFAIPGVIQFTAGLGKETPVGGLWTGIMILTYMWAMMGVQSAPAFTMWAFGNTNPRPFAMQQVWASSLGIGLIMFVFTAIQGMGAHLLGANPKANQNPAVWEYMTTELGTAKVINPPSDWEVTLDPEQEQHWRFDLEKRLVIPIMDDPNLTLAEQRAQGQNLVQQLLDSNGQNTEGLNEVTWYRLTVAEDIANKPDSIVPYYFNLIGETMPWLVGLLAVCALAAMQSTGAAYMSTAGSMLTRDLYKRYLNPTASHMTQRLFGRIGVAFIVISALIVATVSTDALVLLGGLAVAFGFQMWTALAAICWIPWITRQGATWGLFFGLLGVIFTETFGITILKSIGIDWWGRWPLTMHSAGWGMVINASVTILVSWMTQNEKDLEHRMKYHNFLREYSSLPESKKHMIYLGWGIAVFWAFFGIGPGAVIGNTIFGIPEDPTTWLFGIPSIWAWQIVFWLVGVFMMWFLAVKLEMSTVPDKEVEALMEDIGDAHLQKDTT